MHSTPRAFVLLCVASTLAACGGSEPEAKDPTAEAAPKAEKAAPSGDSDKPAADADDKSASSEKKSDSDAPPADAKPKRSLKDMLTTSGALFVFSFAASDVHQAADDKCSKTAKDDPKKKADCMTKASSSLDGDAFQFQEQGENKGLWVTLRRKGNKLSTVHKVEVEFGKETDNTITLVPKTGKEVVVNIPSEGQIVIDDPKNGKMVYELKLGLLGEPER